MPVSAAGAHSFSEQLYLPNMAPAPSELVISYMPSCMRGMPTEQQHTACMKPDPRRGPAHTCSPLLLQDQQPHGNGRRQVTSEPDVPSTTDYPTWSSA